jgi:hypothetical protein
MELDFSDNKVRAERAANTTFNTCQAKVTEKYNLNESSAMESLLDAILTCVKSGFVRALVEANEEISFHSNIRDKIGALSDEQTCLDNSRETSPAISRRIWQGAEDHKERNVYILLDQPAARVHVIDDFISMETCRAMEQEAEQKWRNAPTGDGRGGDMVSDLRTALQAYLNHDSNVLFSQLVRRSLDYINDELYLGVTEDGQEPLKATKYIGVGANQTKPNRFKAHCDDNCEGFPYKYGSRVATLIMYWYVFPRGL